MENENLFMEKSCNFGLPKLQEPNNNIQICIYSRIKSIIPSCMSVNLSCKGPLWLGLLADNNYEAMKLSLSININVTLQTEDIRGCNII